MVDDPIGWILGLLSAALILGVGGWLLLWLSAHM